MSTTVDLEFPGGKKVTAKIEGHTVRVDQSLEDGGEGSAPDPAQLFLSAIATCSGSVAYSYCQVKGVSPEGLKFSMFCEYDPMEGRYVRLRSEITPPPGFPEELKDGLARAIDRCFVKQHLVHPPALETLIR
jgi:ribosomal protein S12 methylthiotransferase accessory factor